MMMSSHPQTKPPCTPTQQRQGEKTSRSSLGFPCHPDEPNLHLFPPTLSPNHGYLSTLTSLCIWALAVLVCAILQTSGSGSSPSDPEWMSSDTGILTVVAGWEFDALVSFLVKSCLLAISVSVLLREAVLPPKRIPIKELKEKYWLPSTLSRFRQLKLPSMKNPFGVHYLRYDAPETVEPQFQALYVNHGFGISSLSYLPVLPHLVKCLPINVALGHDAVGFGLTEPPKMDESQSLTRNLHPFTLQGSSEIGTALLHQEAISNNNDENNKPVILMGHSMGGITNMRMALNLPKKTRKWVILVAPALEMLNIGGVGTVEINKPGNASLLQQLREYGIQMLSLVGQYITKILVGTTPFLKFVLENFAFGSRNKVKTSDVLRWTWPAIRENAEEGFITIGRALAQPVSVSDIQLLEQVLEPETNAFVTVVLFSRDRVVFSSRIRRLVQRFNGRSNFHIVEMEGGHDQFEEDPESFSLLMKETFEKNKDAILNGVSSN